MQTGSSIPVPGNACHWHRAGGRLRDYRPAACRRRLAGQADPRVNGRRIETCAAHAVHLQQRAMNEQRLVDQQAQYRRRVRRIERISLWGGSVTRNLQWIRLFSELLPGLVERPCCCEQGVIFERIPSPSLDARPARIHLAATPK